MVKTSKQLMKSILRKRASNKPDEINEQSALSDSLDYQFIEELKKTKLSLLLDENHEFMKAIFKDCSDIVVREFEIEPHIPALLLFVDGLTNTQLLNDTMKSLMLLGGGETSIERIVGTILPVSQTQISDNYGDLLVSVLGGDAALLVEGNAKAILLGIRGTEKRSVGEPETETVVRGPKEGFVESIRTNTSMIRRKLKTPRLKMKSMSVGKESNTNLVICYLDDLAMPSLIEEVVKRIELIKIDAILESGMIEELIQDNAYSPFPQMQYTERPDVVAAALLQGRVTILTDGTPFALIVPFVFIQIMQTSEDYYERFQIGSLLRLLRYVFMFLSLTTPALYVAITTYHQDLLPTTLMLSVAASREAIPFPAVVEAFIMEITFEALREAGIRLPKAVGSAVSILGALVVGQAAVQAGIVSAPMVIVVSITGIASFTIPRFNGAIAIRMLRFPILMAGSLFGFYGIFFSLMILLGHMANLRSFGIPYLSPLGPLSANDIKDVFIRAPLWQMDKRAEFLDIQDVQRMDEKLPQQIMKDGGLDGSSIAHKHKASEEGNQNGTS
ncbi:putative membrane protein YfkQ [Paenibacillus marchantiophytorum]|uniref:Membrane protein YfkQ n=1 Tax=Paenibacillus marchantiophytorum TaxID=1619310 RepID=A0ABQ1FAA7_9BACL|nr:spore germination protein [Paenibacillus marchantiophytorum]GGA03356.1 putative membrane protein YfkQ [Paenibacillus marchantiophytorum]